MVSRTKKTARKKTVKKAAPRKRVVKKTARKKTSTKSVQANKKAHWKTYEKLQKQVDKAWKLLQQDVKKKASAEILVRHKNHLLLLLGECNYMARQCMQLSSPKKRSIR